MITAISNSISIVNSKKSDLFSRSFILEKEDIKDIGKLYVVLEISLKEDIAQKISEIILEVLENEYFKKANYISENSIANIFESALNKTNEALSTLASEGYVDWINRIHAAVVAIKGNKLHFTSTGQAQIFLLRDKKITSIIQDPADNIASPLKTFTNITSGTLLVKDKILLTTPELLNYITEKELGKYYQAEDFDVFIQDYFRSVDDHANISTIDINIIDARKEIVEPIRPTTSESDDIDEALFPTLNDKPSSSPVKTNSKMPTLGKLFKKENFASVFNKAKSVTAAAATKLANKKQDQSYEDQPNSREKRMAINNKKDKFFSFFSNFPQNIKRLPKLARLRFNRLPRSSKIFFIAFIILAVLFLGSIVVIKQKKSEISELGQHEILLEGVLNKEKEAANALIYNDKDQAKELLQEAREEAQKLIDDNILVAEATGLIAKIDNQMDKVEGITRIDNPIVLADLDGKNIDTLIGFADNVYTYDKDNNYIFELDEVNKKVLTISDGSSNIGYFRFGTLNNTKNTIIFQTDTPSFAEFNLLNKSVESLNFDLFDDDDKTTDIGIFGDRLYRLSAEDNQIFKHTRTIGGFSKGVEWVETSGEELSNAKSITIDGFIYVLKSDGTIIKYLRGNKQPFALEELQTKLENPDRIYTNDELSHIYVIESKNKRVLVYNKNNGKIAAQIQSDQFEDLKDVYVNDDEKKLYILSKDRIFGTVLDLPGSN